jgi:peptidoglycan/xylan/chitin deacetylase (PgdA/CDA1 family)
MQWLRAHGYLVLSLDEAIRHMSAPSFDYQRCVVLTFDDGFRDFELHAWPVLRPLGFGVSVFLPTAFIGHTRRSFKGRECLTWPEVRELHGAGVSFGSHTKNHPKLHGLSWPDVRSELRESRLEIEDELQASAHTFAYPYAFPQEDRQFVARFKDALIDEGYTAAVTTIVGRVRHDGDPLSLKRLPVSECDDEALFSSKLAGAYDWMGNVQLAARTVKARIGSRRRLGS